MNAHLLLIEPLESRIAPATIIVNNGTDTSQSGTLHGKPIIDLRQALNMADTDLAAKPGVVNTIIFQLPTPAAHTENVLTLTGGVLTSNGDVNIIGPGAGKFIVDGAGASGVFDFTDPSATKDSPVSISGLSIVNGNTMSSGGGIVSLDSLTLKGVVVSGNTAAINGGGVLVHGTSSFGVKVSISNSLITGNSVASGVDGAGLNFNYVKSISISNTVITGNTSAGNGAGLYGTVSDVGTGIAVTGSVISGNSSTAGSGAGMYLKDYNPAASSKITISGSAITGNTSGGTTGRGGGGVLLQQGHAVITGSTIENNTATYEGGGVEAVSGLASLTMTGSTISGNKVTGTKAGNQGGGGLFIYGPIGTALPVTITGSHITDNSVAQAGGGIFAVHAITLNVTGSTISGNNAQSGIGGGICVAGTGANNEINLTVTSSVLAGNVSGSEGGGIGTLDSNGPITLTGSKLTGNFAANRGGGMYANTTGAVTMKNDAVTNNLTDTLGGGLAIQNTGNLLITGGEIFGNTALMRGGGMFIVGTHGTIQSVTIEGNDATTQSGGVETSAAMSTLLFKADNFFGNTAPVGPDLDNTNGSTITFS